jgi:hypothetical protein
MRQVLVVVRIPHAITLNQKNEFTNTAIGTPQAQCHRIWAIASHRESTPSFNTSRCIQKHYSATQQIELGIRYRFVISRSEVRFLLTAPIESGVKVICLGIFYCLSISKAYGEAYGWSC